MFFTTIEEWVALAIMTPFCIFCGWLSVYLATKRSKENKQERYNKRKKAEQYSDLDYGLNIIKLDKKDSK
tara:strand:- start:1757 stop:1966 length:210 start_codon:yes stop_codon:yes gene_type:complete